MTTRKSEDYRGYMREYMRKRYARRKQEALNQLGGHCAKCGSTEDLEIDHIDHNKKTMHVNRMTMVSEERFQSELKLCQILCRTCHEEKTIADSGNQRAKGNHGTLSSYRYCRCNLCRAANAKWSREYRKKYGRKKRGSLA